jgi:hypothetical protein
MITPNNIYIVLFDIHAGFHSLTPAPAGFDWFHYPEQITVDDKAWKYVGTVHYLPHYSVTGREWSAARVSEWMKS